MSGFCPPGPTRSQMPDRSGLPSAAFGTGPSRFGSPERVFGTSADGWRGHCASVGAASASATVAANVFNELFMDRSSWIRALRYCVEPSPPDSPDEPANSFLPSASVTVLALPTCGWFLARYPVTVTTSPIFMEFRVHPRRMRPFGLASSKSQLTV